MVEKGKGGITGDRILVEYGRKKTAGSCELQGQYYVLLLDVSLSGSWIVLCCEAAFNTSSSHLLSFCCLPTIYFNL